jgi:hypothetical protein
MYARIEEEGGDGKGYNLPMNPHHPLLKTFPGMEVEVMPVNRISSPSAV